MSLAHFILVLMTTAPASPTTNTTTLATVHTKDDIDISRSTHDQHANNIIHPTNTTSMSASFYIGPQLDAAKDLNTNKTVYASSFELEDDLDTKDADTFPRRLKISTLLAWGDNRTSENAILMSRHKSNGRRKVSKMRSAVRVAAGQGFDAMMELYGVKEPELIHKGFFLDKNHPAAKLSNFNAPLDDTEQRTKAAYASLVAAKKLKNSYKLDFSPLGRAAPPKISLRRTPLEGLCPLRAPPLCLAASRRYRTPDGTCNNARKSRWGSAQLPFHRFLAPAYADGIETVRRSTAGDAPLASARFISLLVHGSKDADAPVTLMLAQWGQFIDHDVTSTAQPRSVNGSVVRCCGVEEQHPFCLTIKVPKDDPWLSPLNVQCLEFLRSAPAQRQDCTLSWREQTNQVTSYLDASAVYSSSTRAADNARIFHGGLMSFGRGPAAENVCLRGGLSSHCTRLGDARASEQPGLMAMHHVVLGEHNRIADELSALNAHWSDEKLYQETRRIIGAMVQHITYREFLTLVLGREVCRLFDLELQSEGYYRGYDVKVNPTVANSFSAAAFRFGHSLIQGSYMRSTQNHQFIDNNVTLHEENAIGDIGTVGSLHRLLRGLAIQRSQKRDEFITPELTNHLFQTGSFPFGLDLAAINIQRGRDHGVPTYTQWREPCGLSPIRDWNDLEKVVGLDTARRIQQGYRTVDDIDLFVAGLAERPVIGGLVGPTFACIIAQQFSNLRKGDRFWYENGNFESSFTPAQLQSIRQVSLAQLICRSLGSGTLQPHVFLPHDFAANERRLCGTGNLEPIDLKPWLERDMSLANLESPPFLLGTNNVRKQSIASVPPPTGFEHKVLDKVDFIPNGAVGVQRPDLPVKLNKPNPVDSKLDFKPKTTSTTKRPKRKTTKRSVFTTTKRSVTKKTKNTRTRTTVPSKTTQKPTRTANKHNKHNKHKRSVNETLLETAENVTKSLTNTVDLPTNSLTAKLKQTLILRPDDNAPYEIEINIRPNSHNRPNNHQYYYNNRTTTASFNNRPNYYNAQSHGPTFLMRPDSRPEYMTTDEYDQRPLRPIFGTTTNKYDYNNNDRTTTDSYFASHRPDYTKPRPIYGNSQSEWTTFRPIEPRPEYYDRTTTLQPMHRPQPNYQSLDPAWENSVTVRPTYPLNKHKPTKLDFDEQTTTYEHNHHASTPFSFSDDTDTNGYWVAKAPQPIPMGYRDSTDKEMAKRPVTYIPNKLDFDSPFSTGQQTQHAVHANILYLDTTWDQPTTRLNSRLDDFQTGDTQQFHSTYPPPTTTTLRYQNFLPGMLLNNLASSLTKLFGGARTTTTTDTPAVTIQYLRLENKEGDNDIGTVATGQTDQITIDHEQVAEDLALGNERMTTIDGQSATESYNTTFTNETNDEVTANAMNDLTKRNVTDNDVHSDNDHNVTVELATITENITTDSADGLFDLLPNEIVTDTDDYNDENSTTAYNNDLPTTTDAAIDDTNTTILFDLDGYLRPEHMHFGEPIEPLQQPVSDTQIDDYVLPSLTKLQNLKNDQYTQERHSDSNILSDDDTNEDATVPIDRPIDTTNHRIDCDTDTNVERKQTTVDGCPHMRLHRTVARDRKTTAAPLFLVPFEVLTKPERPDNWVMFHAMEKVSLPASPFLEAVENAVREMPTPIKAIWRRFQQQQQNTINVH